MSFGGPSTFSQGGNPAPYVPTAQGAADTSFQNIINGILNQVGPTGAGSPAGQVFPDALGTYNNYLNPGAGGGSSANTAMAGAYNAANLGGAGAPALQNAGMSLINTGFDPQNALFRQQQQLLSDQSNVANSMAGLGNTPYGASVNANALGNFDLNWQNQQLQREAAAAGAASPLLQAAPTLAAGSAALPFHTGSSMDQNALAGAQGTANLGNNQFAVPQAIANDLQSYLGLGQSASGLGLQGGQMGFNQTAQGIGGLMSGANMLFGNNGLFSSGASAALPAASAATSIAAPAVSSGGAGLGLLGSLLPTS